MLEVVIAIHGILKLQRKAIKGEYATREENPHYEIWGGFGKGPREFC